MYNSDQKIHKVKKQCYLQELYSNFDPGKFNIQIMGKKLLKGIQNIFKSASAVLAEFGKGAGYAINNQQLTKILKENTR